MADEFPTLEVALAAWVIWLGFRCWALVRAAGGNGRDGHAERPERVLRRTRTAAARDLVVCAVLLGSLAYAKASSLGVGSTFFVLGAVAALLLLSSVAVRLRLAARVSARAATNRARDSQPPGAGEHRRCRVCGSADVVELADPAELGHALVTLGVQAVRVCRHCGHVSGHARESGGARTS